LRMPQVGSQRPVSSLFTPTSGRVNGYSITQGIFEPAGSTKYTKAKWIAPGNIMPTTIKINVKAIDTQTQSLIGAGEDKIGIISPSPTGQPGVPSGNC
jgi:hypothetical protein